MMIRAREKKQGGRASAARHLPTQSVALRFFCPGPVVCRVLAARENAALLPDRRRHHASNVRSGG
eukprot:3288859-Pyramimonas_sp.AAC.1